MLELKAQQFIIRVWYSTIQRLGLFWAIAKEHWQELLRILMAVFVVLWQVARTGTTGGNSCGDKLVAITTLAATAGASLPLLFDRMGLDPALMSAPFITTATDVAGFIYLKTASWLLGRLKPNECFYSNWEASCFN